MEDIEWKGKWFIPGQSERSCVGILRFNQQKDIELDIIGSFVIAFQSFHEPAIIHGLTVEGKKVTLYRCQRVRCTYNTASFETAGYKADFVFVGNEYMNEENLQFSELRCVFADMNIWYGTSGLEILNRLDAPFHGEYKPVAPLQVEIDPQTSLSIRLDLDYGAFNDPGTTELVENCAISLAFRKTDLPFSDVMDHFQTLQRLLTVSFFHRPLVRRIFVRSNDGRLYADVYWKSDMYPAIYERRKSKEFFLFTYPEVQSWFPDIVRKWFLLQQKMKPTYAGLVESFMPYEHVVEFGFLNLAQGLETFHRRHFSDVDYHTVEYKSMLNSVVESADPQYRKWLKQELAFSHEPKLGQRLKELAGLVPAIVRQHLFQPSEEKFIDDIKNSRNYYTHYDDRSYAKSLHGHDLFLLTERMKIFLICLVFYQLEFSDEQISHLILSKGVLLFNHIIDYNKVRTK